GRARPTRRLLLGSTVAFGALCVAAAAAPTALAEGVVLVPLGAASMVFIVTANTTMQLNSESIMRGRVMALYALVFLGSTPIGAPLVGWIAQQWGARAAMAFGGVASLAAAALAAVALRARHSRNARRSSQAGLLAPELVASGSLS
ncbi:MAG: MFS transporter, partial [Acidimicrobiales bacterium]